MKTNRKNQIEKSLLKNTNKKELINNEFSLNYGLVLSTLGRQGSPKILSNLIDKLNSLKKNHFIVLMSEIFPDKLKLFKEQIDT